MKEFFVKNKQFSILLIAQLVVLFVLVIGSFGERKNITFDATELKHKVNAISSGCYDVIIDYETQEQSGMKVVGKVQLISKANQAAINFETVELVGGKSQITTKAWVAFGSRIKDLKVNVSNNKEKLAAVKQVTFRENLIWRVTRVLKWMFIFAVIDVFCLLLFAESKYTLSLNKKYVLLALITICTFSCMPVFYKKTIKRNYVLWSMIAAPICTVFGKFLLPEIQILPVFWGILGSLFFIVLGLLGKKSTLTLESRYSE